MPTNVSAHRSTLVDKDDRALASIFAAYTISATRWLLFATAVGILLAYRRTRFRPGAWQTFG